jgi:hypothetical protein
MLGVLLAVLMASPAQTGAAVEEQNAVCRSAPPHCCLFHRACYLSWLHSLPYSQAYYAQNGYDFRRERNIPWAVRANYSLPVDTAASSRHYGDATAQREILPEPTPAAPPSPRGAAKPTRARTTGSK